MMTEQCCDNIVDHIVHAGEPQRLWPVNLLEQRSLCWPCAGQHEQG